MLPRLTAALALAGLLAAGCSDAKPSAVGDKLVESGYGFLFPKGWVTDPLVNEGGPASHAAFVGPGSTSRIDYEENGGSAGSLYDDHDQPVTVGLESLAHCDRVISHVTLHPGVVAYGCRAGAGLEVNGVIRVRPYPEGYVDLEVTLPASQHPLATKVLNSFLR